MGQILDLKVFKPEPRKFRVLDGEKVIAEVDVSRVPTDSVISILANMDVLTKMEKGVVDHESFDILLDVAVRTCKANDESINREWLLDHLDVFGIVQLIIFIIQPVLNRLTEGGGTKKKTKT